MITRLKTDLLHSLILVLLPLGAMSQNFTGCNWYFGPQGILEQRGCPKVVTSSEQSYDVGIQQRLWTVSEELTKVVFPVG